MTTHDLRLTTRDSLPHGRVLIIAGSDSGGGAGIQGDIKTVSALGGYAMTAITALTAQNTRGVSEIHPVPADFVAEQIRMCLSDIGADAIKTGMLHSAEVIESIVVSLTACAPLPRGEVGFPPHHFSSPPVSNDAQSSQRSGGVGNPGEGGLTQVVSRPHPKNARIPSPLRSEEPRHFSTSTDGRGAPSRTAVPLIVDPVMVAKGGAPLLEAAALHALKTKLIPMAALITPNLPEAELLLGRKISADGMEDAARALLDLGCAAVLLKGGHGTGEMLTDVLVTRGEHVLKLTTPRIATRNTHGTGCAFASAIATGLAQQLSLADAVRRAHAYVQAAIARAPGFGAGNGPLGH